MLNYFVCWFDCKSVAATACLLHTQTHRRIQATQNQTTKSPLQKELLLLLFVVGSITLVLFNSIISPNSKRKKKKKKKKQNCFQFTSLIIIILRTTKKCMRSTQNGCYSQQFSQLTIHMPLLLITTIMQGFFLLLSSTRFQNSQMCYIHVFLTEFRWDREKCLNV